MGDKKKGQIVLFFILLGAVGIIMMIIMTNVLHAMHALKIDQTLYVSIELDDKGTEIISLLNSNTTGIKYMEIVGDFAADNHEKHLEEHKTALKGTLIKLRDSGYNFYVTWPEGTESLKEGNVVCETEIDKNIFLIWPVPESHRISSAYKENRGDHLHGGIDIPGDGLGVLAAAEGEVVLSGWEDPSDTSKGFGKRVTIKHTLPGEKVFYTIYGHLSEIFVRVGDYVMAGQKIGKTGNTGYSTGSHLHFEVADGPDISRNSINPCPYLGYAGNPECIDPDAPGVSMGIYGTEIPIPGARPGMLKGEAEFLC